MALPDTVKKGDRVKISPLGIERGIGPKTCRVGKREGTIVGCKCYGYTRDSVRVVWDGNKEPYAMHRDFLDLVEPVPVVATDTKLGQENANVG